MLKEFVKYLKHTHCYDEYIKQLTKHHKDFHWIEKRLKPIHWVDSVFLWSDSTGHDWEKINFDWLEELQNFSKNLKP